MRRVAPPAAMLLVAVAAAAGCGGDGGRAQARKAAERAAPAGTVYTSDQLKRALLTELPGYQRAGEPASGEYGNMKAIQNFNQLQRQVKLDKPQCAKPTAAFGGAERTEPTALTTFARGGGQSVTETLMAVTDEVAIKQVRIRVPASCRTFKAKVGNRTSTHQVVEAGRGALGLGSRIVGVATRSGGAHVKTWYVVLRGRGYVASLTVFGANANRAEAVQVARQAHDHAERILP